MASAPRGGAAAAQSKSLGRLRRLVDDSPGPSIRSLLSFACVSPIKSMGYFVRPGLVAVADISATLRVRFPFRVPREVGLFHARVRVRAAAALHVRRLSRHRRRRREHGRRGRRRAHRGACSSCASTGRPSSSLSLSSPSASVGGGAAAAMRAPCQSPTRRSRLPSRASARSSAAAAARARAARAATVRAGARAVRPRTRRRRCPLRRIRSVFLSVLTATPPRSREANFDDPRREVERRG